MFAGMTALCCYVADPFYRIGLAGALEEAGCSAVCLDPHGKVFGSKFHFDYLVVAVPPIVEKIEYYARLVKFNTLIAVVDRVSVQEIQQLRHAGVSAVLSSQLPKEALLDALSLASRMWILSDGILYDSGTMGFTMIEWEVLKRLVDGHSNQDIAEQLNLALRALKNYRASIFRKTRSHDIAGVVRWWTINHLGLQNLYRSVGSELSSASR